MFTGECGLDGPIGREGRRRREGGREGEWRGEKGEKEGGG